jgi:hypothetical protein
MQQDLVRAPVVGARMVLPRALDEQRHALVERPLPRHARDALHEAVEGVFEDGGEHAVLAPEVVLDGSPRDAGPARDLGRGRPLEPDLDDALAHGGEDRGAGSSAALGMGAGPGCGHRELDAARRVGHGKKSREKFTLRTVGKTD